jgi:hypothetical protein
MNSSENQPVMVIDADSRAVDAAHQDRYLFLDSLEQASN